MALLAGFALAVPLVTYDLDEDDGGFLSTGETGQWRWGDVRNGPGAGYDGPRAWATGLDADYLNDTVDYLEIPIPALQGASRPTLRFVHWYDVAGGDAGWIEIDDGGGWVRADPIYGYPDTAGYDGATSGWETATVDLADAGDSPRVRLAFAADATGVAEGWFVDQVSVHDGDVTAPTLVEPAPLADTDDLAGPYVVEVEADDDTAVTGAELSWSAGGGTTTLAMAPSGDGRWSAEIPGQPPDTRVRYRVRATDGGNEAWLPRSGDRSFRVYLPAPRDLTGPGERVVATTARLSWSPPDTRHDVLGYRVHRGDAEVAEVEDTSATVALSGTYDVFSVRAVYEAGEGDPSDEFTVDALVPSIAAVDPGEGWPGDTLRLTLTGAYLLFQDGFVALSLGDGVSVGALEVRDVDTLIAEVAIDEGATPGGRTAVLLGPSGMLQLADAFEVLPGDARPRLTSVSPAHVRQGDEGELVLGFVGTMAATPTADLGEGVVVQAVEVDGARVRVTYAVATDAPIGERAVELDDGERIFDGVSVTVRDVAYVPETGCGVPGAPGVGLAIAGAAAMGSRRRRRA